MVRQIPAFKKQTPIPWEAGRAGVYTKTHEYHELSFGTHALVWVDGVVRG
jgi:hypothetical protein